MTWKKGQSGNPNGGRITPRQPRTSQELDVRKLAQQFTRPAIATMAAIMRNRDNPPNVRLAAADALIKRGHGAPIQPLSNPDLTPLTFDRMTDDEIANAIERIDRLGQSPTRQGDAPGRTPTAH